MHQPGHHWDYGDLSYRCSDAMKLVDGMIVTSYNGYQLVILRMISFGKPTYWVAGKFPYNCDQCYQRYSMVLYGYIITYSVGNILPFKHVASWCVCDLGWLKLGEAEIHSPKLESMIAASGCQEKNVKFIDPKWDDKHW